MCKSILTRATCSPPFAPGQIDAAMTDTSIALAEEKSSDGKSIVVGQYKTGETYGAIYEKGSANAGTIDKIIQAMIDDGTMKKLAANTWPRAGARIPLPSPISNNFEAGTPAPLRGFCFAPRPNIERAENPRIKFPICHADQPPAVWFAGLAWWRFLAPPLSCGLPCGDSTFTGLPGN